VTADVRTTAEPSRQHPMPGQVLMSVEGLDGDYDTCTETRHIVTDLARAHVVTSLTDRGAMEVIHKPVLDIDFPVKVVPSSTPGHCHLYLDRELTWPQYARLLRVMAEVGLVEPGYVNASIERRHTAVRLPWIRKAVGVDPGQHDLPDYPAASALAEV
jgi:hypothetical protein